MSRYFEPGPMDRDTLQAVLPVFIKEVEELRDRLASAEARSDPQAVKRAVHQLRGTAGAFGATCIHEQSTDIEDSLREQALSRDELGQKLDQLCATVSATLAVIEAQYR